jgi:serine protease Do
MEDNHSQTKQQISDEATLRAKKHHQSALIGSIVLGFIAGFIGSITAMAVLQVRNPFATNTKPQKEIIIQEGQVIADIAEEVGPSVVSIAVESSNGIQSLVTGEVQQSAGTGLILTKDGIVVTNRHVIPTNGGKITVVTSDGTSYNDVSVIDRDPLNDVAFLQIKGARDLTPAVLGDSSEVRVGDRVVAIGNALGKFSNTVTSGIISGTSRPIIATSADGLDSLDNLLQTDASINPGNSGGPLVNIDGDVIGINTAIADQAENIGFSIPINDIKPLFTSIQEEGRIIRPYLGVRFVPVTPDVAEEFDLSEETGALVVSTEGEAVLSGSPAEKAGIREGDIILAIEDDDITETTSLTTLISDYKVGDTVEITVNRDGKTIKKSATLEEATF